MANHFSSCGAPKFYPNRFVSINILGEGVEEKVEQLNGSDLGGCKLIVMVSDPTGILARDLSPGGRPHGHGLSESVRREMRLKAKANKALHEAEMKRCAERKAGREEEIKRCAQKEMEKRNEN